jgi:type IV pilus assembly protein PilY1
MLAIGSGPTSMDANSAHAASLIVVDLKTGGDTVNGGLKKIFTLPGGNAFANEPVVLDKSMNYNADAVYVAANYNTGTSEVFRLTIPQEDNTEFKAFDADGGSPEYVDDPADARWKITKMVKSPRPITASGTLSVDRKDNAWLYLGTGRFMTLSDKTNTSQNYILGVKDPFFNPDLPACNYSYPAVECEINKLGTVADPMNDLFDAGAYEVYNRSKVEGPGGDEISFDDLVLEARRNVYQGWYRELQYEVGVPSERVVNKGAVLGGVLLMPTFKPDTDPCRAGGSSRLFGVYYETGTAFFRKIFNEDPGEGPVLDVIDLGDGIASSLSIHSGRQQGGKVYVQKSTGEILEIDVDPPFNIKSGPVYWLDDGYY